MVKMLKQRKLPTEPAQAPEAAEEVSEAAEVDEEAAVSEEETTTTRVAITKVATTRAATIKDKAAATTKARATTRVELHTVRPLPTDRPSLMASPSSPMVREATASKRREQQADTVSSPQQEVTVSLQLAGTPRHQQLLLPQPTEEPQLQQHHMASRLAGMAASRREDTPSRAVMEAVIRTLASVDLTRDAVTEGITEPMPLTRYLCVVANILLSFL